MIYYYVALKAFKLPPVRSIKSMGYIYFFWMLNKTLNRLLGAIFFVQGEQYNYMLDAMQQAVNFAIFFAMTYILKRLIIKYHAHMKFIDTGFFNKTKELMKYFLKATFLYVIIVIATQVIPNQIYQNIILNLIMILFIICNIYIDLYNHDKQIISNKTVHISGLFKGMEEFRGIKHDFYNILHTYSGCLELEAYDKLKAYHESLLEETTHAGITLELAQHMSETQHGFHCSERSWKLLRKAV